MRVAIRDSADKMELLFGVLRPSSDGELLGVKQRPIERLRWWG